MLRAASVGLGWWSGELAGAIQGRSKEIQVASCFSRSPEKRSAFAEKFGTRQHPSYAAALDDPDVDAVVLTTPHSLHVEHVMQAAAAGKHVFVEKPLALTAETARAAAAACEGAGVVLAVGLNRRFSAAGQAIKAMWEAGEFGDVVHLEANFSAGGALGYRAGQWRAERSEMPAGTVAGLGVHMLDLMCWLAGPATRVVAQAKHIVAPVDIDDTSSAIFEFASGPTGYLGGSYVSPYTSFLNVYGTKANAFAAVDADQMTVQAPGKQPEPRQLEPVDTLKAELEEFAGACSGGAPYRVRPEEAVHNVAVMEAMMISAARNSAPINPQEQPKAESG